MDILETLFSSGPRVRILRAFLFQPEIKLSASEIAERADVTHGTAKNHADVLTKIDFLKKVKHEGSDCWQLNNDSKLRDPLHRIILMHQKVTPDDIADRLRKVGDVSLLILSGIFTGARNRPIDVLIVGKNIDKAKLSRALAQIEKNYGTELCYTHLPEDEFSYRFNVYDRLIRDVLDYPHQILINDLKISAEGRQ
ncbi:MAG: helix-turn-helix domain-containing protein [Candidatus Paceibacterota bacterium]